MARQNSKYFSSVIEKLIADKHEENIVADESFMLSLRENVVARAAMMPRMEGADALETGGFAGFVNRWKYALALVPSALLVMVVASQVMNMPVAVESEVVGEGSGVLTSEQKESHTLEELRTSKVENSDVVELRTLVLQSEGQEEAHTLEELRTSKVENSNVGELRAFEVETNSVGGVQTKKIKTFPGALVMPAPVEGGGGDITTLQSATDTSEVRSTSEVETSSAGGLRALGGETTLQTDTRTSEVESNNVGVVRTPYSSVVPDRTGGGVTSFERIAKTVRNDESLVVADRGDSLVAAPIGDGMGGGSDDSLVPTNDYATRNLVNPSLAVPLVMKNADLPAFNVTYETSLSGAEKAALETNVILPLTEGRDVQRVVVGRDANGYVSVIVFYGDGSSASSTYSFNSARGVWDKVTYVQPVTQTGGFTYKTYKINY